MEENELNEKILGVTIQIQEKHAEISKYLDEMTVTIPNEKDPVIHLKQLKDYYESLKILLKEYE